MEESKALDKTKTILITGAAGFIGFHLAYRLLVEGQRGRSFVDQSGDSPLWSGHLRKPGHYDYVII